MRSAKRFLSVILAVIMVCSTLVIGANAAYNAYKGDSIKNSFNELDKPVLTMEQYASAAMDEIDRMLKKEDMVENVYIGTLDLRSVDNTFDSVYNLVTSRTFEMAGGLIGDLGKLSANALRPESAGGVRRGTAGKSDLDIIYALIEFLHDNKQIFVDLVRGNLNMGSLLDSLLGSLLPPEFDITDVSGLVKGMLIPEIYGEEDTTHTKDNTTYDQLAQDAIDMAVLDPEVLPQLEGYTDIGSGNMYNFIDNILKVLYNALLVDVINTDLAKVVKEFCGVVFTTTVVEETVTNPTTGKEETKLVEKVEEDRSNLNSYVNLVNIDYVVPEFEFSSDTTVANLNNLIKSILDVIIKPEVFTWQGGDNSVILDNIINLAKAVLVNTGTEFFPSYIKLASADEINAMSDQEVVAYILRCLTNSAFEGAYIPEDATTSLDVAFYAMQQLLATEVPELDFSGYPHNTDSVVVMLANYGIDYMESEFAIGLDYVTDMAGVDAQINTVVNWVIENFGGVINGITLDTSKSGWDNLNTMIFSIIDPSWLPAGYDADIYSFIMDGLVQNLVDLDFDAILALFEYRSDSELQQTPKQVIINLLVRVVNIIFPGAMTSVSTLEAMLTNEKLATLIDSLFETLWVYRTGFCEAALPIVCDLLSLTSEQEFEFPSYDYERMYFTQEGGVNTSINIRNNSTGINTGYTDKDGNFHLDQLYTYDFKSVTSNVAGINFSNPGKIAAGAEGAIAISGSFGDSQPCIITVTYDILTEDGTALTDEPINENLYLYLASTDASDEAVTGSATGGSITITGIKNIYASSMSELLDYEVEIVNNSTTAYDNVVPYISTPKYFSTLKAYTGQVPVYETDADGNPTDVPVLDENGDPVMEDFTIPLGTQMYQLNTEPGTLIAGIEVDGEIETEGSLTYKLFEPTETYENYTKDQKKVAWEALCQPTGRNYSNKSTAINLGVKIGGTTISVSGCYIAPYNDFGLYSALDSEITRHRLASGYSDAAAWDTYISAMKTAVTAAYSQFTVGNFNAAGKKASSYDPAATALEAAVENLEQYETSEGVASTQAIIDSINPSNTIKSTDDAGEVVETAKDYDDPTYSFFGKEDYVRYTYQNYRDKYKTAQRMIDRATIPNEDGEVEVISDLDITYNNHRLSLYADRLLRKLATTKHLDAALADNAAKAYVAKDYTEESWANYQRALTFATAVAAEDLGTADAPALRQSKVNTAYNELLEAEKRLIPAEGGAGTDEPVIELVNPEGDTAPEVVETLDGLVLVGIYGGEQYDMAEYFNLDGCYIETEANDAGVMSTGATVTIKSSADNSVIATYTLAVTGDINGDGNCDSNDSLNCNKVASGILDISELLVLATDLNNDSGIDGNDALSFAKVVSGSSDIDYANRCLLK